MADRQGNHTVRVIARAEFEHIVTYPFEAEAPIVEVFTEREDWINVSPSSIAIAALTALTQAGWKIIHPDARNAIGQGNPCPACGAKWEEGELTHTHDCALINLERGRS